MMSSRKYVFALLCMFSAIAAAPAVAKADVNVVIGVAPPHYYHGPRHGHIAAPGYWHFQGHRNVWVSPRSHIYRSHGFFNHHEVRRYHHGPRYDSRSHWNRGGHDRHWQDRGRGGRGHGHHGHRRGRD